MNMVDFRGGGNFSQNFQHPHRKPVPVPNSSRQHSDLRPLTKIHPDTTPYTANTMNNRHNNPSSSSSGYTPYQSPSQTTVTTTYSAFPPRISSSNKNLPQPPPTTSSPSPATTTTTSGYNNPLFTSRRTPSQSTTTSTHSIHHHNPLYPARHPSDVSSSRVSRTSSTRSSNPSPSSYVALMRKQKATVWCDRSQHEDPRTVAQKKAAKIRATREIAGSGALDVAGRTSTSGSFTGSGSLGVRSKIRHHGVPKASGYSTANMVGGGVPMRLSANEVGDEGTYLGNLSGAGGGNNNNNNGGGGGGLGGGLGPGGVGGGRHVRTSSAHSRDSRSISGGQYLTVDTQGPAGRRMSQGSTPISGGRESIPELSEDMPDKPPPPLPSKDSGEGYWGPTGRRKSGLTEGDRENSFGKVGGMDAPVSAASKAKQEGRSDDDLRRRGSVDERANTMGFMGGGRLFVANPDLSD